MIRAGALIAAAGLAGCAGPGAPRPEAEAEAPIMWTTADEADLTRRLLAHPAVAGSPAVREPAAHRLQLLVSEVREGPGGPTLVRHGYRLGAEYFYPASTIKLAAAIAACQEVERLLRETGLPLTLETPTTLDPLFEGEHEESSDPANLAGGTITIGHEIRKLFIVSDNPAFNRLYDLVGQERLNRAMWDAGLASVRITHRLSIARTPDENRLTRRIVLHTEGGDIEVPIRRSPLALRNPGPGLLIGQRHLAGGGVVEGPMDFSDKNGISLVDLQDMLIKVVRPDLDLGTPGFDLSAEHRDFLLRAMREVPGESANPRYDPEKYPDDWVKYLLPGLERVAPREHFTIYNKVGMAYGFLIENACVVHEPTGRMFFLTATVYANPNGTLNDSDYAYDTISLPLMSGLGQAAAETIWTD